MYGNTFIINRNVISFVEESAELFVDENAIFMTFL